MRAALSGAVGFAAALGFKPLVARARVEAADALEAAGDREGSATRRAAGLAMVDEMAAPIHDVELRGGFLATARRRLSGGAALAGVAISGNDGHA